MGGGGTEADGLGESLLMNDRLQVFENPTAGCAEARTEPAGPQHVLCSLTSGSDGKCIRARGASLPQAGQFEAAAGSPPSLAVEGTPPGS